MILMYISVSVCRTKCITELLSTRSIMHASCFIWADFGQADTLMDRVSVKTILPQYVSVAISHFRGLISLWDKAGEMF